MCGVVKGPDNPEKVVPDATKHCSNSNDPVRQLPRPQLSTNSSVRVSEQGSGANPRSRPNILLLIRRRRACARGKPHPVNSLVHVAEIPQHLRLEGGLDAHPSGLTSLASNSVSRGLPRPIPLGPSTDRDDIGHHPPYPPIGTVDDFPSVGASTTWANQDGPREGTMPVWLSPMTQDPPLETRSEAPPAVPGKSTTHHLEVEHTPWESDTLSSDSTNSLKAQLRQVNRRLDDVQKEFTKSKEEMGESSKGGSLFTPEI
ncbi:hypothetical protein BHM03_00021852 [Ensete ventricosum]|nr:hypothetical protein BHM03_00021852 [Ensete ventricosum]